jgi:hypothetical protein
MKEIILNTIKGYACSDTGSCQINMQSEVAQNILAERIMKDLEPYINSKISNLIEDIVCGVDHG